MFVKLNILALEIALRKHDGKREIWFNFEQLIRLENIMIG